VGKYVRGVVVILMTALWLAPVYLLIVNAVGPPSPLSLNHIWDPPGSFDLLSNLSSAWHTSGFGLRNAENTVAYSLIAPAVAVLFAALAGFAIIILRVRFAAGWFVLIFGATILPLQILSVPLFLGYGRTHLYDTRLGMVMIYVAVAIPFAMFVMRNFFGLIARSVYEAAVLDGASVLRIFFRIYVPMSWSALIAVFILQFTFVWNDLFLGLSLSTATGAQGVTPALFGLTSSYGGASYPVVLAAALGVTLPTVLLFLFAQRFFAAALSLGQS
jgi:multiple sugar transport system permease protein